MQEQMRGFQPSSFIYFILFLVYTALDMIYPYNGIGQTISSMRIYPQIAMGIIFVYSILFIVINITEILRQRTFLPFLLLLLLMLLYVPLSKEETTSQNFIQFMKMNMASVVLMGIYLSLRGRPRKIKWVYSVFVLLLIDAFYTLYLDYQASSLSIGLDTFDSNSGFMLASLMPMCLMIPSKRAKTILYLLVTVGCLFCGQRSAALSAIIAIPFAYSYLGINSKSREFWGIIVLTVIVLIALLPTINSAINNIIARQQYDMERGGTGSGRLEFWRIIIGSFVLSDTTHLLFGYGFYSTNALLDYFLGMPIQSHNGFLEHLYSFGIIGLLVYVSIYVVLFRLFRTLKIQRDGYASLILMMLVVFIVRSVTSHGNLDVTYIPFFLPLAIILAEKKVF